MDHYIVIILFAALDLVRQTYPFSDKGKQLYKGYFTNRLYYRRQCQGGETIKVGISSWGREAGKGLELDFELSDRVLI